jgi:hypothetical protein
MYKLVENRVLIITFYSFIFLCCAGGILWHLEKFLWYIKYIILKFTPSSSFFIPPPLTSWNSCNRFYFSIYMHVHTEFAPYSPSYTLSPYPPPPTGTNSPDRTCFALLFSNFVKNKQTKRHICLFQAAIQGISLWHIHNMYILYIL